MATGLWKRTGVAVLLGWMAAEAARGEMLPEGWAFRRAVAFKQIKSDAPGENAAWVEFYTNGQHQADGADLRVTSADRLLVAHKVMQVSGENDLVRVAFQTRGDGPYYVWWGNAKAEKPAKELELRRGIAVEVFKLPAGAGNNRQQVEKLFAAAKQPVGSVFARELFLGHNPLGEEWTALMRYRGQFRVDKPMRADFAFEVNDTGWLMIDGKVVDEAYRKGWRGEVRDPKRVELAVGWHEIEVVQANLDGGNTGVVVAWKGAEEKKYSPLPGAAFAQAAHGVAGPLEKVGATYVGDFTIVGEAEAFSPPDAYMPRYVFEAVYPATFKPQAISWDFGDGQKASSALKKVSHYYLTPGTYTVTMKLEQGANAFEATRRIVVRDRLYEKFPDPPEDKTATTTAVLKDYDVSKLSGEQALRGLGFLQRHVENEQYVAWGRAWAKQKDTPNEKTLFDEVFDLARLMQLRKEYKEAAQIYLDAAGKPVSMEMRLNLLRYYVMTQCDYADDAEGAMKEIAAWGKKINEANRGQVHALETARLYAAVARGDEKTAKAALAAAGTKRNLPYNEQQIRQGVLARNIEAYITTKEHDTALKLIDQWENEYPETIWEGFTRTLRVKLYAAEGKPLVAARVAVAHAKANANGFYAAELLYRASELFKKAGEETQAKAAMELLRSKYPESPYAREAGGGGAETKK